ncbi:MAG: type II secretion system protein M [Desulfobulbaceae bacterium]|jgi:general secretion pathway protein M|nr:type II secretion system protein M [Desulfobulbaceae bacterium]
MIKLNQREKMAVGIAGVCLFVFVVLQFIVFPLVDKRAKLIKGLATREKAVVEMRSMQARYRDLSQQRGSLIDRLAKREAGFSLFSFLEKNAADSSVKEQIAYMKPSESAKNEVFKQSLVEMKLQAVGLQQLVEFLEKTESPEQLVGIDKITIQENTKEEATLDVTLQMVSVDQATGASPQ